MRRFLSLLVLVPVLAFAKPDPIRLSFDGVSLIAFSQATFVNIMRRDFVISPDVYAMDRKITISVKKIDSDDIPQFVEGILRQQGIETTFKDGVYYLTAKKQEYGQQDVHSDSLALTPSGASVSSATGREMSAEPILAMTPAVLSVSKSDDESVVYMPINRSSEFMASVVGATFGRQAVIVAGSHMVLTGSKLVLSKMRAILDSLDELPKMVDVSASWVEVAQNSGSARGISLVANVLGAKLGATVGTVNTGSAVTLANTNFQLAIEALNSDGRFKQVSNSRVVGDDREKLTLTVGDETPTVSSTGKDNAGNAIQNVVYRPSGVIVDVLPKVLGGGRINMVIDGQISSFKSTSTGVSGSPTLIKRQVKTVVTVNDGEVLLIGGLTDTQTTDSSSGFAFLPASWSAKSGTKVQTDLVLVLSAKLSK